MRRVAGDDQALRCMACSPRPPRRLQAVVDVAHRPAGPPVEETDPATKVAARAVDTAVLLASLDPCDGGTHEGEARTLADMAGRDVATLRRAMTIALAQENPAVSTIAGALLMHAYEVATGLRLR